MNPAGSTANTISERQPPAERQQFVVEVYVAERRKYLVDARTSEEAESQVEQLIEEMNPEDYSVEAIEEIELDAAYPEES